MFAFITNFSMPFMIPVTTNARGVRDLSTEQIIGINGGTKCRTNEASIPFGSLPLCQKPLDTRACVCLGVTLSSGSQPS